MIDDTPPATYMLGHPTATEVQLVDDLGLKPEAPVPAYLLARLAGRHHAVELWAAPRSRVERWLQRGLFAALTAAVANAATCGYQARSRAAEDGAAKARADDQAAQIVHMQAEILAMWQLRAGESPVPPTTGGDLFPLVPVPKEFSLIVPPVPSCTATVAPAPPAPLIPLTLSYPKIRPRYLFDVLLLDGIEASIHTDRYGDSAGPAPSIVAAPGAAPKRVGYAAIEASATW